MSKHMEISTIEAACDAGSMREIGKQVMACMQCGTCTGSCSSSQFMDYTPRQLWRMVQAGLKEDIFNSRTFSLCSSCYFCTLRCPRGLPLTETMGALKRMACREGRFADRKGPVFYDAFLKTVRKHGRVREAEMMTRYFAALKDPVVPLSFAPLAMQLMAKRKIRLQLPGFGKAKLDGLFKKVEELEKDL